MRSRLRAAVTTSTLLAFATFQSFGARADALDPGRIVSIGGSVTEIIYALGMGAHVVGVDTTSVYPPEALRDKPNVGYMRTLSAEGVLSLQPSGVVAIEGSGPASALKQLDDAHVPVVITPDAPTPEGVAEKIETIGALLGQQQKAHALAANVRARFAALESLRPQVANPPRVLFLLSLQNGRPMAAGRGTAADAAIRLVGGVNAAEGMDGYKPMTDEAVIAAAPDFVLKMTNGNRVGAADELFALPAFAATTAAKNHALIAMDGPYLLGFGPREPDALHDLMAAIFPGSSLKPLPGEPIQ